MEDSALLKAIKEFQRARATVACLESEVELADAHVDELRAARARASLAVRDAHRELMRVVAEEYPVNPNQLTGLAPMNCENCALYHANVSDKAQTQCLGEDAGCCRFRAKEGGAA